MKRILDPLQLVRNADRLVEIYDGWPHFHDSEVIEIRLARSGEDEYDGPNLWIQFHLFRGRVDETTSSGFAWYDHHMATLRFGQVRDLELRGFNRQNAIYDLELKEGPSHPESPRCPTIQVNVVQSFGIGASFLCSEIEVTSVVPGIPPFSVYTDGTPRSGDGKRGV